MATHEWDGVMAAARELVEGDTALIGRFTELRARLQAATTTDNGSDELWKSLRELAGGAGEALLTALKAEERIQVAIADHFFADSG